MHENTMKKRCAINASLSFKRLLQVAAAAIMACATGACQEPPYRTEITPNLQGGVEVHRVPKDAPRPSVATPEASNVVNATPVDGSSMTPADRAKRIAHLEALIQDMNEEIARLKRAQAADPATAP
jgi:hypothetical protein